MLPHLLHEGEQGFLVVLPFSRQLALMGELVAAQVDGELQAVGVQVTEVIDGWWEQTVRQSPSPHPTCPTAALPQSTHSRIWGSTWPR